MDTYYFNGFSDDFKRGVIVRVAKRNFNKCEVWLIIKDDKEYYIHPKHPLTEFDLNNSYGISSEGIQIKCIVAFQLWNIKYSGKLKNLSSNELVDVKFDLKFRPTTPIHDTEKDIEISNISKAIARESWTKEFFEELKNSHQIYYD